MAVTAQEQRQRLSTWPCRLLEFANAQGHAAENPLCARSTRKAGLRRHHISEAGESRVKTDIAAEAGHREALQALPHLSVSGHRHRG